MENDLLDIVEDDYIEPVDWSTLVAIYRQARKEAQKKNCLFSTMFNQHWMKSIFPRTVSCKTTTNAWKALQEGYQGSD